MDGLDDLIDDLHAQETEKQEEAARIREATADTVFDDGGAAEEEFLHTVERDGLDDVTIAGIDGGLARKPLHSIDLLLTRAVAAVFSYRDGELATHEYRPKKNPTPDIRYAGASVDRRTVDTLASLLRLQAEISLAVDLVADVDVLMLDGALLPQYRDKPSKDAEIADEYNAVLDAYEHLYETAQEHDTLLIGVVEDTRNTTLCRLLQANGFSSPVLERCRDTHLLSYMLEQGERTLTMAYTDRQNHTIIGDLETYGHDVYSAYLQTVAADRPVRIDIFGPDDPAATMDRAASLVYALSGFTQSYGLPAILTEADRRAKLTRHEVEMVTDRLQQRLGHLPGLKELRRDRRPL